MTVKDYVDYFMEMKSLQEVATNARHEADEWERTVMFAPKKKEKSDNEINDFLGELVNYIHLRGCKGPIKDKWSFYIHRICDRFIL